MSQLTMNSFSQDPASFYHQYVPYHNMSSGNKRDYYNSSKFNTNCFKLPQYMMKENQFNTYDAIETNNNNKHIINEDNKTKENTQKTRNYQHLNNIDNSIKKLNQNDLLELNIEKTSNSIPIEKTTPTNIVINNNEYCEDERNSFAENLFLDDEFDKIKYDVRKSAGSKEKKCSKLKDEVEEDEMAIDYYDINSDDKPDNSSRSGMESELFFTPCMHIIKM